MRADAQPLRNTSNAIAPLRNLPVRINLEIFCILGWPTIISLSSILKNKASAIPGGYSGFWYLAEREGFEPPMPLRACRISSAVHSTTLPPLRLFRVCLVKARRM